MRICFVIVLTCRAIYRKKYDGHCCELQPIKPSVSTYIYLLKQASQILWKHIYLYKVYIKQANFQFLNIRCTHYMDKCDCAYTYMYMFQQI